MKKCIAGSVLLLVLAVEFAHAGPGERPALSSVMAQVWRETNFLETAISPDARWVAWSQSTAPDEKALLVGSAIYLAPASHHHDPQQITAVSQTHADAARGIREKALAWSPDSSSLAFLSDAQQRGQFQLYITRPGTHSVRQLTHLKGFLASPSWSPDGRSIALLFTENA
ncbi:MAG: hypothetical protein M3O31_01295, partial [Acidobacteriota bacterium]|nr:hypothetical protein [Acidobacteriota bacterium]